MTDEKGNDIPDSLRGGGYLDEQLGFVPDAINVWVRITAPISSGAERLEPEDLRHFLKEQ